MSHFPRLFLVSSPELEDFSGGWDDGPPEYFRCAVEIETERAADAKALALRTDEFSKWRRDSYGDNPFAGITVEEMKCPEGFCCCSECKNPCPDCKEGYDQ